MASNYNIMANYIVSKYIERVSGKDLGETFVDDDPSKRVMVGMLSEDRVEAKFEGGYVENTNTRFDSIPSISISFIVKKNESGILHVIPAGLLFYMVQPSYEKTVQYMLERYSEKDSEHYTDILQLCECYPEIKFNLPLTYKKIDIASVMADGIEIKLSDITPGQTFHLKQKISEKLSVLADQIANEICIVSQSRISFFDLTEPDRFRVVTGIKDERVLKVGYVLHRNEANQNMMPTYQRIIKKARLKSVRSFINDGGYFPNSIIISIDSGGRGLVFDQTSTKVEGSISKLGILHIPKSTGN